MFSSFNLPQRVAYPNSSNNGYLTQRMLWKQQLSPTANKVPPLVPLITDSESYLSPRITYLYECLPEEGLFQYLL